MGRLSVVGNSTKPRPLKEDQFNSVLMKFDFNKDSLLSMDELKKAYKFMGANFPAYHAERCLHLANANNDGYVKVGETDKLVEYAVRYGFAVKDAKPSRRDGHDKYYGDSFTKADANNAKGDSSIQAINANIDSFIQANNANGDGLNINADATDEGFINEEDINERAKYATRYGFPSSFESLTKEQLMKKLKQCDVNNVKQLSKAEIKKRFLYFDNVELNKLVENAPKFGFTVEP